jgi:2'-5' RNA ligase
VAVASLWLMPEGDAYERLSVMIARLAARLGTTPFKPHVTLLTGLEGPEGEIVESAQALAAELAPLHLDFAAVDGTEQHFRCLFLRVGHPDALRDAHSHAARRLGLEPDPAFDPHLSLVYGTLSARQKNALARELTPETQTSFDARRLHVWRTDLPVEEWREVAVFGLAG